MYLPKPLLQNHLLRLLELDLGLGDITTDIVVPPDVEVKAEIVVKEARPVILAGLEEVFYLSNALGIKSSSPFQDGDKVDCKTTVLFLEGKARDILVIERTALNILMRMTAIATITRNIQDKIRTIGSKSKIAATRKTLPGFIYFDKKAVAIGGGDTHRLHLEDMVLIKNNHLTLAGGLEAALRKARERVSFSKKIEVEVKDQQEAIMAVSLGADIVMLDNFSPLAVEETINVLKQKGLRERVIIEVSGRITPENVLDYAVYNPEIISCGALTHSVKAVDMSLRIKNMV